MAESFKVSFVAVGLDSRFLECPLSLGGRSTLASSDVKVVKDLWPKIRANLSLAKKSYAAVGFPSEKDKPHPTTQGMTVAQVAAANEVGSAPGVFPIVPARPFMAQTVQKYGPRFKEEQKNLLAMISKGEMSTKVALNRLGSLGASSVKETIADGDFAPNAPYTAARKGSSKPLIDTGAMRQSVTWVVRMRSGVSKSASKTAKAAAARAREQVQP